MTLSFLEKVSTRTASLVNRVIPWHRFRTALGAANLYVFRQQLRAENLHNTREKPLDDTTSEHIPGNPAPVCPFNPEYLYRRSSDGTYNDLTDPMMGAAHTRFGRNVPLTVAHRAASDPKLLEPSPRIVSEELLARTDFKPATSLNLLAAAWIQFQTHDWFHHGTPQPGNEFELGLPPQDKWQGNDGTPPCMMRIRRTPPDPTRIPNANDGPPTFLNDGSHWWDGSQIYGNSDAEALALRTESQTVEWCGPDGRCTSTQTPDSVRMLRDTRGELRLTEDRLLPFDPSSSSEKTGLFDNWWIGLSLLHTLFAQEHNAIAGALRLEYPTWDSDRIFHTARLINVALMAKIHTVEWTPAILGHPTLHLAMNANWSGFVGAKITDTFGRLSDSEEVSGIPGSPLDHHHVPFSLTEEFVSVYRLHPLLPDSIQFYHANTGVPVDKPVPLENLLGDAPRPFMLKNQLSMDDVCYSFAIANPGAPVLQNFPGFLRNLVRPEPGYPDRRIDLAAIDIMRDRERGVPRYNEFRELVHRGRVSSFSDITSNKKWAADLERVYGHVDRVDLMAGMYAEDLPEGFGFSDTAFRIFILMASRRIKSDRFFTTDYNANVYTQMGLDWIARNNMRSVILRHFPSVAPSLSLVQNAFAPWTDIPVTPSAGPAPIKTQRKVGP